MLTRAMHLELPEALFDGVQTIATKTHRPVEEVLVEVVSGALMDRLLEDFLGEMDLGDTDATFSGEQPGELVQLLQQDRTEPLDDAGQIRLSELLQLYRHHLVRKAQAITDWLTIETMEPYETAVTQLVTVQSSMLYAIGYDPTSRTLEVVFNSGGIYRYLDVPPAIYEGLFAADSKGRYMWEHVFNLYPYQRLRMRRKRRDQAE